MAVLLGTQSNKALDPGSRSQKAIANLNQVIGLFFVPRTGKEG